MIIKTIKIIKSNKKQTKTKRTKKKTIIIKKYIYILLYSFLVSLLCSYDTSRPLYQ